MTLAATIKDGATALSPTGGTDILLAPLGINNGVASTFVSNDTSMLTRRSVDFSAKDPKANAASPGGMTQARRKVVMYLPRVLTVGSTTVVTQEKVTIEASFDISATQAQINNMRYLSAQLLTDSELDAFWQAGSLV